ncbi:MAG: PQQ-binding-like beta-propeller repeat protein, partial [Acidobacteria bacterium]|nr:PQQ-binding-like beta-propeller repeat protein [Acidobacteriota bacterium]
YKATALFFAADKGHVDVIKLLLDRGADVNAQDTFYKFRPLGMASQNGHTAAAILLLQRGSLGATDALMGGIQRKNMDLINAALASSELTAANLRTAIAFAKRDGTPEIVAALDKKAATIPPDPSKPVVTVDRAILQSYAGTYRNDGTGTTFAVTLSGDQLSLMTAPGQPAMLLVPSAQDAFTIAEAPNVTVSFAGRGGIVERLVVRQPNGTQSFERVAAGAAGTPATGAASAPAGGTTAPAAGPRSPTVPPKVITRTAAKPWPGFRGDNAAGNGDGQGAITEWDAAAGKNVRWKTPIPGFATASPIVWGNRIFVVSAESSKGDKTFRTGLYGDVAPVEDLSEHTWKIYCLEKATGKVLWEKVAFTGVPKVKRHTKSTQANSTPVTDGTRVVALFGSIGLLAAWDMHGKPLWTQDLGVLDSGWFFDPSYQWGHSSSPVVHDGKVIVQADVQKNSFIAAYDVKTGKQVWKTDRDEISTWGTPTVFSANGKTHIVTNGTTVRAYDPATGTLTWKLGPNSEVTVGTPVVGDGLVYVTGGYPPVRPIYAVKPTASGDITMAKDATSSDAVAWSNTAGTYIPTPLYYDGIFYTCGNDGILTAYDAKTGTRLYRARVGGGGSFSASPIAADGKLYFANEDGDVVVVRAGPKYEELAKNQMKEVIMSTPAISDGLIVIRTLGHVYGIGGK